MNCALGVVAVTYGAGALNVVNAVAGAYAEKSPVVVISGNEVLPAVAEKVDVVLTKPVGGSALMSTIRQVAATKRLS